MDFLPNLQWFEKAACFKAQMIVCFQTFLQNCTSQNENKHTEMDFEYTFNGINAK